MKDVKVKMLLLIAHAELAPRWVTFRTAKAQCVGAAAQKATLLALGATEGAIVSIDDLSAMSGCSSSTTHRALECLKQQNIVGTLGITPRSRRARAYRIDWEAVAALIPVEKLDGVGRSA